eukprot:TRINITY_DN8168_c1_g1_i1.p1 TRINITY_DN8168_c1_g1~~TRINITY_DN8168_c1_g1_i1.p1  ORF type:complete len:336 (-),score=45.37 TRINITY_DN8168_c1_g1_i1:96-1103(-)
MVASRCLKSSAWIKANARRSPRAVVANGIVEDVQNALLKPITTAGQNPALTDGIRAFYDESSGLWEDQWGEHMHCGFYDPASRITKTRVQAQIDMIEEILKFAEVTDVSRMVDVGCGIGGSSRYISKKHGCLAEGITLSPVQAQRANELAGQAGMANACNYRVADALDQPFEDGTFDLVWSLESGEHMPDKRKFVNELFRVATPGGTVAVVTWCHRNLAPGETALKPEESSLLDRICEAYYLPKWCSEADYRQLFGEAGYTNIKFADWSDNVAPFWGEVLSAALTPKGVSGLLGAGWETLKGAIVIPLMQRGFELGVIKFVIITGNKPVDEQSEA